MKRGIRFPRRNDSRGAEVQRFDRDIAKGILSQSGKRIRQPCAMLKKFGQLTEGCPPFRPDLAAGRFQESEPDMPDQQENGVRRTGEIMDDDKTVLAQQFAGICDESSHIRVFRQV